MKPTPFLLVAALSACVVSCAGRSGPPSADYGSDLSGTGMTVTNPYYGYSSSFTPMEADGE